MLGRRLINTGAVSCTTDTVQILNPGSTQSEALYRFEDNANDTAYTAGTTVSSNKIIDLDVNGYSSGSTISNSASNTDDATIVGNITYSNPSGSNGRFDLDGSADYLQINGNVTFNGVANFTLEGWFKPDNITNLDHFFTIWDGGSNSKFYLRFNGTSGDLDGYAYTSAGGTAANVVTSNAAVRVQVNKFNHIVMTYTDGGSGSIAIYINGALAGSATPSAAINTTGTAPLLVGVLGNGQQGNYDFDGEVGQVRFYTSALSATEVLQNFNATRALYAAYDGTESNITYATGKFGKSAVFNGSSSLVTVSSSLPWANSFSISMWLKPNSGLSASSYYLPFYQRGYDSSIGGTGVAFYMYGYVLRPWIGLVNSTYYNIFNTGTLTANQWNHVVLTRNYGVAWELYLNGISLGTYTAQGLTDNFSDTEYYFGGFFGASYRYDGQIDQARIFDKALNSGEVNSLYNETATSAASGTIDNPSTIAYYKMADGTDETGNYNGTTTNVDFNVIGKYGFAGKFNGLNSSSRSKIITSNLPTYNNYSISFWMNSNDVATDADILMGTSDSYVSDVGFGLYTGHPNDGDLTWAICDGSSRLDVVASGLSADQWHHVVITQNISNNEKKIYIDNTLKTTSTSTINNTNVTYSLIIGGYQIHNNSAYDGKLDQVRIFNKAISASEVTKLYNETQCDSLVTTPESYFNTVLYPGDSGTQQVTGVGFTPDLVWIKARTNWSHSLQDTLRGPGTSTSLYTDVNSYAGQYGAYGQISVFGTDGFTVTTGGHGTWGYVQVNGSGYDYVSWNWKAGGTPTADNTASAGSAPTSGSVMIDGNASTTSLAGSIAAKKISANTRAGFSIVEYEGSGANSTVGHGLSSPPALIVVKRTDAAGNWIVYSKPTGVDKYLYLNTSGGENSQSGAWGSAITSTTFGLYSSFSDHNNASGTYVAYCFANVDGYQRISSYLGNGSANGPIIYTGFEPAWLLIKKITSSGTSQNWTVYDNKRDTTNPRFKFQVPNSAATEGTNNASNYPIIDFQSNGFQIKGTDGRVNTSGSTYLFMAIAANPDTTAPTKANSFNTKTFPSNNGTQPITGLGFKPDFVWTKSRTNAYNHSLYDSVRGVNKLIQANTTNVQSSISNAFNSFDLDGFTLGSSDNSNSGSGNSVAWAWKALDHDRNLATINYDGGITSIVSANPAAGFSIVRYNGNSTAGATIGTGLSSAAQLIFVKSLNSIGGSSKAWTVYAEQIGNTDYLYLNSTAGAATYNFWNNTSPTSTVFSVSSDSNVNSSSGEYIAYCWHSVAGYSKIGSYTGNGNTTGPSTTVGFRPSWVLIKKASPSSTGSWYIFDAERAGSTTAFPQMLYANVNNVEYDTTGTAYDGMVITTTDTTFEVDFSSAWTDLNALGTTYLYMAFK